MLKSALLARVVLTASLSACMQAPAPAHSGLVIRAVDEAAAVAGTDVVMFEGKPLVLKPGPAITGDMVLKSTVGTDRFGSRIISFSLTPEGTARLTELTAANVGNRLAIMVDGEVKTAPVLMTPLTSGEGQITGPFTEAEANAIADAIMREPHAN